MAWSRASVTSDWVLDEASQGREMRKLVPVSFDGTLPPISFRQYLSVDLLGWNGESEAPQIDAIVRGIAAVMGRAPTAAAVGLPHARPPAPTPADVQPRARLSRRTLLLAATGTAVAGAAGWLAWRNGWLDSLRSRARRPATAWRCCRSRT